MVRLKKNNIEHETHLKVCEDESDQYRFSDKLMRLINDPNPTDVDEFFDALDEDCEEFVKRVWGEDNDK